ncbi:MAG: SDR family oxidoreductase, partial [Alphaproteobacteria bacterium]|nr:SDR family oxidoreductase [Alphaproteobacteria bacterium]
MHRILLTGATGFLGKMVLFKLLQRDDVERVYLFMRPKGDQTVEERFEQSIIGNSMFEPFASRLRTVCRPIEATQELPLCGVSESNLLLLRSSVTGVINCVASIRFNLAINRAYVSNVKTLQNLLELAKQLPLMEHFVHTSTAYVFARKDRFDQLITCPNGFDVDQDAYFSGITEQSISEDLLAQSHYPNSYTFTKSLAEYVIRQEELPFAFSVVRPSIITSSHLAPYPGWVESEAGYLAYVKSIIDGGVPMLYLNRHNRLNLVPVDHVADILSAVVTEHRADVSPRTYYATASIQHTPSLIETLYVFRHIFRTISKKEIRHLPLYLPFGWMFSFLLWLRDKLPRKLQAKRLTWQGKKTDARRLQRMGSINEQLYAQYRHFLNQPFHFHDNLAYEFGETHRADLYHSIVIRKSLKKAGLRHDGYEVFAGNDMITRHGDLFFALSTKGWNVAKRVLGLWFLRLSRHVFTKVEINMENLLTALATMPKGATVVFAPTHKSYFDFLLLYFLCFAFPELKIYG